jgi:hypothetical protein
MVSRILVDPHPPSWQGVVVHSCKKYLPTGSLVQLDKGIWDKCMKARLIYLIAYDWPVEHGIECCNLIHTHRRDVDNSCNLIHYRDGGETILSLAEIQKRHNSRLLVLRRVALENFFDSLLVVLVEFKRNAGIVLWCVAMLYPKQYTEFVKTGWNDDSIDTWELLRQAMVEIHTTNRWSDKAAGEEEMLRFAAILRATAEVVAAWRTRARTENMFVKWSGENG